MKMLRKNVLLDMGELLPRYKTMLIEIPDEMVKINNIGNIVSVAKGCKKFTEKDIGRKVIMGLVLDSDSRIKPELAKELGLKEHWHFITSENNIHCLLDK